MRVRVELFDNFWEVPINLTLTLIIYFRSGAMLFRQKNKMLGGRLSGERNGADFFL